MHFSLLLMMAGCLVSAVLGQNTRAWTTYKHDRGHTTDEPHSEPTHGPYGEPTHEPYSEPYGEPTHEPYGEPTHEPYGEPYGEPTHEPYGEPNRQCAYWMGECKKMYERSMERVRDLEMWDRCIWDVYSCMTEEEKMKREMMSRYINDMIRWKKMDDGDMDWGNHSSLFLPSVFLLTTCMAVANWLKLY